LRNVFRQGKRNYVMHFRTLSSIFYRPLSCYYAILQHQSHRSVIFRYVYYCH
jgi:hypothetical protein